ncbi:MAG: hypothetical protein JOZ69_04040 [Myxococcales bacterium]|nr:hypothetical protein [Myxococcales bacterium]
MSPSHRRIAVAALCAGLGLGPSSNGAAAEGRPSPSSDVAADRLAAARALFAEALRDEQGKRFGDALSKFERVREVRDTASVEYRVGACHEGLGERVRAYVAYRRAVEVGRGDPRSGEVVAAARDRLDALARQLALLTVVMPEGAPAGAEVRIDGAPVTADALTAPIPLAAGSHVVAASAPDRPPVRSEITLSEGATVSLTIDLDAKAGAAPVPPETPAPDADAPLDAGRRTAGWIALVGGGALVASTTILAALRAGDIATLNQSCPHGACPADANRAELQSTHDRAVLEGPLAIGLGVAGAAALAAGAYFLATSTGPAPAARPAAFAPWWSHDAAGFVARGSFR